MKEALKLKHLSESFVLTDDVSPAHQALEQTQSFICIQELYIVLSLKQTHLSYSEYASGFRISLSHHPQTFVIFHTSMAGGLMPENNWRDSFSSKC